MENLNSPERTVPPQYARNSRAFRQFKNPPQPHMCIQDTIKNTNEKLFINVLGWQKIANPKQYSDPIPLYGGMQVPQGCGPNSNRPPLLVFAVMVNPDILRANGKNAVNSMDRDALVSLLCDFVEAMNPGLLLARSPVILKDRDLAGELKDVWLAVQNKREREKGLSQDVMYKVYDIDGIGNDDFIDEEKSNSARSKGYNDGSSHNLQNRDSEKKVIGDTNRQSQMYAQESVDLGLSNCEKSNSAQKDNNSGNTSAKMADTTSFMSVQGQIVSSRENHSQINDIHVKFSLYENMEPSTSFRKDFNSHQNTDRWNEFSKRDISSIKNSEGNKSKTNSEKVNRNDNQVNNGKSHYNFFPVFDNKTSEAVISTVRGMHVDEKNIDSDKTKIIIEPMQKLVLHTTDNKICDSKKSALSSISS